MALRKNQSEGQRAVSHNIPSTSQPIPNPQYSQFRSFSAQVPPPQPTFHDRLVVHPPGSLHPQDQYTFSQHPQPTLPNLSRSRPTTPNTVGQPPSYGYPTQSQQLPTDQYLNTPPPRQLPTSRPQGPPIVLESSDPAKRKKKAGLFSSGRLSKVKEEAGPRAWIAGEANRRPYLLEPLINGHPVQELWQDNGNLFIYLYPQTTGKGASFCIDASVISSSAILSKQAWGSQQTFTPGQTYHVWLPLALRTDGVSLKAGETEIVISSDDIETLVQARNVVAFLCGQSLTATARNPTFFSVFLGISDLLRRYAFSNQDGSTYGDVANASFEAYVQELSLGDVRQSVEKTVDMLVLGERMKSVPLYNEAYVHAVGKYDEVIDLRSPQFDLISQITKNRLEKSHIELGIRIKNIEIKLNDFEFPGLFAGLWISKASPEAKNIRFDRWRDAYNGAKSWFRGYYRSKYGSWPPKAKPKKNGLETGGLSRAVLLDLYTDLSALYNLLVDRASLTTRSQNQDADITDSTQTNAAVRALRIVLGEYDRSTPPVQPPIPFDAPLVPTPRNTLPVNDPKEAAKVLAKKYKKDELRMLLSQNYNADGLIPQVRTPFLEDFLDYDFKAMEGHSITGMADIRYGQWCFFYAVLQSLPMLVVDAPEIHWTKGVEYFLCRPPRSGVPWAMTDARAGRVLYGVAGSDHVVYLPSDLIEHGVEGVYRRSHCWTMAAKWTADDRFLPAKQLTFESDSAREETYDVPHAPIYTVPRIPAPPAISPNLSAQQQPPYAQQSSPGLQDPSIQRQAQNHRHSMVMLSNLEPLGPPQSLIQQRRRSMVLGETLEPLPMPQAISDFADGGRRASGGGGGGRLGSLPTSRNITPMGSPQLKPVAVGHVVDPSKTFDAILGTTDVPVKGKKKK